MNWETKRSKKWKNKKLREQNIESIVIPKVSDTLWEFIEKDIPMIGNKKRDLTRIPYMKQVYNDTHKDIIEVFGRQTGKTTKVADRTMFFAAKYNSNEIIYVADNQDHKSSFSRDRLRKDGILANPKMQSLLPHGHQLSVDTIEWQTGVTSHLGIQANEYRAVEGKSILYGVLDETQYHDLQFIPKAMESLSHTHGFFETVGIGGEVGSTYHKRWLDSDQHHWFYDDDSDYIDKTTGRVWKHQGWRNKLTFDNDGFPDNSPKDLETILDGQWIPQNPRATDIRGYWIPQEICVHVPLTIDDAINKYKIQSNQSIEWKEKYYPRSLYIANCRAEFYKSMRRPITPAMVESCYDFTKSMLSGSQVITLKKANRSNIQIFLGIDWGSGPAASQTVGAVVIYWIKENRYELVFIDPRPEEHEYDQSAHFVKLFNEYGCDYCVADMGYGKDKVTLMQNGGHTSTGEKIIGLGSGKIRGCWTSGNLTEETHTQKEKTDIDKPKVGKKLSHYTVDKTQVIQNFIDMLGTTVSVENNTSASQFIIPMKNDWECGFLVNDFCDTTRKDLAEDQESVLEDGRQKAKKEFNHPQDSMMAIIYVMIAKEKHDIHGFDITLINRNR